MKRVEVHILRGNVDILVYAFADNLWQASVGQHTFERRGVGGADLVINAVSSGRRNIEEALWPEDRPGSRDFGRKPERAITTGGTGRDPKRMCGSPNPFDLADGLGNGRGYHSGKGHGGAGHSRTGEGSRFSFGGLVKDMLIGGIVGGLGSAGFYGAGKAVEALKGSIASKKSSQKLEIRDRKFLKADGDIDWDTWAPNGGRVLGTVQEKQTINAGVVIDRYGSPNGRYVSPAGVPYEQRALPYVENPNAYHRYKVLKAIDNVTVSQIAEAFEQPGGGIQYELPVAVKELIRKRILKEIR